MACRLTVWCQLLIHCPAEMRAWWRGGEERKAEGQHGWQTMPDRDLDQASGRKELQCKNRLVNSPDCIGYMPDMIKVT